MDGVERIDISILGPCIVTEPTRDFLSGQVMRVDRPRPHEIKEVRVVRLNKGVRYELFIVRDPCPVLLFGGTSCPICGGTHENAR